MKVHVCLQKTLSKQRPYFIRLITIVFLISAIVFYWHDHRIQRGMYHTDSSCEILNPMELSDTTTESIVQQFEIAESL